MKSDRVSLPLPVPAEDAAATLRDDLAQFLRSAVEDMRTATLEAVAAWHDRKADKAEAGTKNGSTVWVAHTHREAAKAIRAAETFDGVEPTPFLEE